MYVCGVQYLRAPSNAITLVLSYLANEKSGEKKIIISWPDPL